MKRGKTSLVLGFLAAAAIAVLATENQQIYQATEKAYYAAENLLNFVRPGLQFQISTAAIASDATITARIKVLDKAGGGLDKDGLTTPGVVAISFVISALDKGTNQYRSYIFRTQTSPITNVSAQQPTSENNGTFTKVADGEYTYTFRNKATGFDPTATHTISVYGSRNLTDWDLGTNFASTTYSFVPSGSAVTQVHDVIKNATCNTCHGDINAHGGSRRGIQTCVLCHYEGVKDPDTGNDIGLATMSHKLHMGSQLPSVKAGKPYQIVGFNQTVVDFSKGTFPADIRSCNTCHVQTGTNSGTQANRVFQASRFACGSCHDDINFAAGTGHLAQANDENCTTCHRPQGTKEFDISITGAHTIPILSSNLKGVKFTILDIVNTKPGQKPTVTFKITDNSGAVIAPADMTSLTLRIGGPSTDYKTYFNESARTATLSPSGIATYTFTAAVPDTAAGTYTLEAEGYRSTTFPGLQGVSTTARDLIRNQFKYFSVDGNAVTPRRQVVSTALCNNCHRDLQFHGGNRNNAEACVICHNPTNTDASRRTAATLPAESINFPQMVHRIHKGSTLARTFTISTANYNDVNFPNELKNCRTCHLAGTQNVPISTQAVQPVADPRGWWTTPGQGAGACLACHDSRDAAAHAYLNTSPIGESCGACHSAGKEFGVDKVHAQ